MEDYPTTKELAAIKSYDILQGIEGLLDLVEPHFAEYGNYEHNKGTFILATGGWSGCEEVIGALLDNVVFWTTCWEQSKRGGWYKFRIPKEFRR